MSAKGSLHWADYLIFVLTVCISLGIGVFHAFRGDRQSTTSEYLLGNRQMKVLPVALSMLASIISAISFVGDSAEMYAFGTQYSLVILGAMLGTLMAALVYVPLYYPLKITSIFEYLEIRYKSRLPRVCTACLMLFKELLQNGTGLFAPAIAIQAVVGVQAWITMLICVVTATIYTSIGGIKAVIWADVFQSLVMFGGLVAVIALGTGKAGGISNVWRLNEEWGRISFFDMDPDPTRRTTFWSVSVALSMLFFIMSGSQPMVQRFVSLPSYKKARLAVLLNVPGFTFATIVTCLSGIIVFGYYASISCDPLQAGYIDSPNQVVPYFVVDVLNYPGFTGLFMACLTSAALSSSSSSFNSAATIFWEDLVSHRFKHLSEAKKTLVTKFAVGVIGLGALAVGMIISRLKGTLIQIGFSFVGAVMGPVAGMTLLGATIPRVGPRAATIAMFVSLSFMIFMCVGSNLSSIHRDPLPGPIDGCDLTNSSASYNSTSTYDWLSSMSTSQSDFTTEKLQSKYPVKDLTGLPRLFAVSYVYYPAMGIGVLCIVGTLLSFLPFKGFKQVGVPEELLFKHVRVVRRWLHLAPSGEVMPELDESRSPKDNDKQKTKKLSMHGDMGKVHPKPDDINAISYNVSSL